MKKRVHLELRHQSSETSTVETRGDSKINKSRVLSQIVQIVLNVVFLTGTDMTGLQLHGCLSLSMHPNALSFFSLDFWLSVPQLSFPVVKVSLSLLSQPPFALISLSTLLCAPPPSTWTTLHLFSKPLFLEEKKKYMKSE